MFLRLWTLAACTNTISKSHSSRKCSDVRLALRGRRWRRPRHRVCQEQLLNCCHLQEASSKVDQSHSILTQAHWPQTMKCLSSKNFFFMIYISLASAGFIIGYFPDLFLVLRLTYQSFKFSTLVLFNRWDPFFSSSPSLKISTFPQASGEEHRTGAQYQSQTLVVIVFIVRGVQ